MDYFADQVRLHCHRCGVPLRGHGELAQMENELGVEQTSADHASIYRPKRVNRPVEVVTSLAQLGLGRISKTIDYIGNAQR